MGEAVGLHEREAMVEKLGHQGQPASAHHPPGKCWIQRPGRTRRGDATEVLGLLDEAEHRGRQSVDVRYLANEQIIRGSIAGSRDPLRRRFPDLPQLRVSGQDLGSSTERMLECHKSPSLASGAVHAHLATRVELGQAAVRPQLRPQFPREDHALRQAEAVPLDTQIDAWTLELAMQHKGDLGVTCGHRGKCLKG